MFLSGGAGEPVYTIGKQGLFDDGRGSFEGEERLRPVGLLTLSHHLIAVDFLVALTVGVRGLPELVLEAVEPEWTLWRKVAVLKENRRFRPGFLVSDGAFTLRHPAMSRGVSYHLEVVRAGVRGGNDTILQKLRRYIELQHQGFFRAVFGHQHLRAVVFVTPTHERAEHLRQLAATLPYGQQLFWFGSYEEPQADGRRASSLTPERILEHRWCSADGQLHSFTATGASGAGA